MPADRSSLTISCNSGSSGKPICSLVLLHSASKTPRNFADWPLNSASSMCSVSVRGHGAYSRHYMIIDSQKYPL